MKRLLIALLLASLFSPIASAEPTGLVVKQPMATAPQFPLIMSMLNVSRGVRVLSVSWH